jgi:hypothetical protein
MKKVLFTFLITLGLVSCQPEQVVVWDNPSAVTSVYGASYYKVLKVELKESETIMHLEMGDFSGSCLKFTKESALLTDDGQEYALMGCVKTCDDEMDIQLDSLFRIPRNQSGRVALHFQPLPLDTRKMHFRFRGDDRYLQLMNICDASNYVEPEWPDDWKSIQYDDNETLEPVKLTEGEATIKAKVLDYHPDMHWSITFEGFQTFNPDSFSFRRFYFDDEGNISAKIPMRMTSEVEVRINNRNHNIMNNFIVMAPGKETEILLKAVDNSTGFLAFKGYMAKTNTELKREDNSYSDVFWRYNVMDSLENCDTPEERIQCLKSVLDRRIEDLQSSDYTPAAKELLCINAEAEYLSWCRGFGYRYLDYLRKSGRIKYNSSSWSKLNAISDRLLPDRTPNPYTFQYLNGPTAPISHRFWNKTFDRVEKFDKTKSPYIWELHKTADILYHRNITPQKIAQVKDKECKKILQDYVAKEQRMNDLLKQLPSNFHYKTYDDVDPRDMFQVLLGNCHSKAIVVYLWASFWNSGEEKLKAIASISNQLKDKDVQFIYVASAGTRPKEWYDIVKDLPGEHYNVTNRQFSYLLRRYDSEEVPTLVIYDKEGNRAYQRNGKFDLDSFQKALEEVLE